MKFNEPGQDFHVIAFDELGRVTGQAASITSGLSIDGGARNPLDDANPTEIGTTGEYVFDLLQAETNGHALSFTPVCATPGVQVLGVPSNVIYTFDSASAGGSVNVLPAVGISADRSPGVVLRPFVGETISQSITLYQTDGTTPIVLTGKSLEMVFETRSGTDVAVIANGSIVVSGDDDNVVTFSYPSAVTLSERVLRFSLRDDAAPATVYLTGICKVAIAPGSDPP
jgi:hypothetical protein